LNARAFRLAGWPWLSAALQAATLLLIVRLLGLEDYGRYATAYAIASMLAPLLVAGPAFVYLNSHPAFGCSREGLGNVWQRALLVMGTGCAALVPVCMAVFAGERDDLGLWFVVGVTEIVLAGFIEMIVRHYQAIGHGVAMAAWRVGPHAVRLLVAIVALVSGIALTLPMWIGVSFVIALIAAVVGMRRVPRRNAPRAFDALFRLLRTGFRYDSGGAANRVIADADKPFAMRMISPGGSGSLFLAQRLVDLVCVPLHATVADTLPHLLDAEPMARRALWWKATLTSGVYAVLAGGALFVAAPMLRWLGPEYAVAASATTWLCWLPLLGFARGMLGNAAVVAGRGALYSRGHWLGAFLRIAGAVVGIGLFGWRGAIGSLFVAELVPVLYFLLATKWMPTARHRSLV
jgi:O-antigen/teichoic acid export membrane protein